MRDAHRELQAVIDDLYYIAEHLAGHAVTRDAIARNARRLKDLLGDIRLWPIDPIRPPDRL